METADLIAGWRINQQINLRLLEAIDEQYLVDRAAPRGRTVGEQWAHVSNVRVRWLDVKAPTLPGKPKPFPKEHAHSKLQLRDHLIASAKAFEGFFEKHQQGIRARDSQQNITVFYAYMIAHEAHHRGQIILHLKLSGHNLPSQLKYSLWDW